MPTRCTAQTRAGRPCRQWAVRGSDPPRCSVHGGRAPPVGDLLGARTERPEGAGEPPDPPDLDARIADLDRRIMALSAYIDQHAEDLDAGTYIRILSLYGELTSRLGRLMRDRHQMGGGSQDEVSEAISQGLEQLSLELGIDL